MTTMFQAPSADKARKIAAQVKKVQAREHRGHNYYYAQISSGDWVLVKKAIRLYAYAHIFPTPINRNQPADRVGCYIQFLNSPRTHGSPLRRIPVEIVNGASPAEDA